ncbi:MAG: pantetheine-phosphate adenylyltransferase [Armatimonadota bacterium]
MCPGSFDPVTYGHLHVIERATKIFGRVIVSVAVEAMKAPMFSVEERVEMLRESCAHLETVEVDFFEGMTVEHARRRGAIVLVKGLRAISDFEAEYQMALTNRRLAPEVQTVFMMTDAEWAFLSSSMVKEIARLGGDFSAWVPPPVVRRLRAKFGYAP